MSSLHTLNLTCHRVVVSWPTELGAEGGSGQVEERIFPALHLVSHKGATEMRPCNVKHPSLLDSPYIYGRSATSSMFRHHRQSKENFAGTPASGTMYVPW